MPELEGLAASVRGKLRERCARGGYAGRDVVPRVGLADEPLLGFDPAPLLPVAALEVVGPCRLRGNAVDVVGERQERGEATLDSGALPELALDEPDRCIARGNPWLFGPEAPYERDGDVNNVVFPCGYTVGSDGDTLNLYYGAADSVIALAQTSIRELLAWLAEYGAPPAH
jgi:hypothetical protein